MDLRSTTKCRQKSARQSLALPANSRRPQGQVAHHDRSFIFTSVDIRVDDLTGPEIAALLNEHLASMYTHSPPESVHALPIEKLRSPDVTFWSVWEDGELLGCGALKELDREHGEIKSMRTVSRHLRKGVARAMLNHIIEEAKRRGYHRLSLETGSMAAFEPARKLYARAGFTHCKPFGDYIEDPNSVFMTMALR